MPVYNGAKYLNETIKSVLNSTLKQYEFLIVNDGSNEKMPETKSVYKNIKSDVLCYTDQYF